MAATATDYMEGSLNPRQWFAVRLHLLACSGCRAFMAQLRRTRDLLRLGTMPPPSPEQEDRAIATLHGTND